MTTFIASTSTRCDRIIALIDECLADTSASRGFAARAGATRPCRPPSERRSRP